DCGSTTRKSCGAPVISLGNTFIYEVSSAANAWTNWINGTQQFTTGTNSVSAWTTPSLGFSSLGAGSYYDRDFAEFVLYNRVLLRGERALVNRYLGARYGVAVP